MIPMMALLKNSNVVKDFTEKRAEVRAVTIPSPKFKGESFL